MWKIIKTEILYWAPAVLAVYGLFAVLFLLVGGAQGFRHVGGIVRVVTTGTVAGYLTLLVFMFVIEMQEKRIRRYALLPIPIKAIGYARLVLPFVIMLIFAGIAIMQAVIFTGDVGNALFYEGWASFRVEIIALLNAFLWLISFVYLIRAFSEFWGRIFLLIYVPIAIFQPAFIPSPGFMLKAGLDLQPVIIAAIAIIIIYFSFSRRRTFLSI